MHADIFLPAYNEETLLESNALRLLDYCRQTDLSVTWKIIIIVNGSSDNTESIARRLADRYPTEIGTRIYPEPGRGQALLSAWGASQADIFAYMDCDLAVGLEALPLLISPLAEKSASVSIGSRFLPESRVSRSWRREIISRLYNQFVRLLLGNSVRDLQCGFKALRSSAFKTLKPLLRDSYWLLDTELLVWAERLGLPIAEVPVNWQETRFKKRASKVRVLRDARAVLGRLLVLRGSLKKNTSATRSVFKNQT